MFILIICIDTAVQYVVYGFKTEILTIYPCVVMRFLPKFFVTQTHVIFWSMFLLILFTTACLMFEKMPQSSYIMLNVGNSKNPKIVFPYHKRQGHVIGKVLSKKLVNSYERFIKMMLFSSNFMTIQIMIGFPLQLFIIDMYDIVVLRQFPEIRTLICDLFCAFHFRYVVYTNSIAMQFLSQNSILQIKQKHYLEEVDMKRLFYDHRNRNQYWNFRIANSECLLFMSKIVNSIPEFEAFNKFYSKYITASIILYGTGGCSMLNAVIQKTGETPFIHSMAWIVYAAVFLFIIFLINAFSSRTIYLNVRIFKRLRQIQAKLLSRRILNYAQIVKLDLVNEYKVLLQKCSFRLLNSILINNKLFVFHIFTYVSLFYMKLFSDSKRYV